MENTKKKVDEIRNELRTQLPKPYVARPATEAPASSRTEAALIRYTCRRCGVIRHFAEECPSPTFEANQGRIQSPSYTAPSIGKPTPWPRTGCPRIFTPGTDSRSRAPATPSARKRHTQRSPSVCEWRHFASPCTADECKCPNHARRHTKWPIWGTGGSRSSTESETRLIVPEALFRPSSLVLKYQSLMPKKKVRFSQRGQSLVLESCQSSNWRSTDRSTRFGTARIRHKRRERGHWQADDEVTRRHNERTTKAG